MAADRKGNVIIANNKGVSVFEGSSGKLLTEAGNMFVRTMALMADGNIMVVVNRGFTILEPSLKPVREFKNTAEAASSTGGFSEISVDGQGNIYALDSTGGDICKFAADGKFLTRIPSGARSPNGIAMAPSGRIAVSDTNTIYVLTEAGQPVKSFKTNQAFGITFNDAGELFVASRPWVLKYKLNF